TAGGEGRGEGGIDDAPAVGGDREFLAVDGDRDDGPTDGDAHEASPAADLAVASDRAVAFACCRFGEHHSTEYAGPPGTPVAGVGDDDGCAAARAGETVAVGVQPVFEPGAEPLGRGGLRLV